MKRQEHIKQLCESHPCVKTRAKVAVYLLIVDFLHATFALSPQKLLLLLLKELGFTDYLLLHTSLDYLSFCWWGTIKVYCYWCSNTVFFMNTGKKKVLNKYISKQYSWWEMCLLSNQQQELLAPISVTTWIAPWIQVLWNECLTPHSHTVTQNYCSVLVIGQVTKLLTDS